MAKPLISQVTQIESYRLSRLTFDLAAAYRTLVEIIEYYDRMDGYDEMDRLNDVRQWLQEALRELFGEQKVAAWDIEAVSTEFTPFAP